MNNQKICFILCVNSQFFFEECLLYLERLLVPEGFEVEVRPIWGADSMTNGYNRVMPETDAKYKIYMHQDTLIVNKYFLHDMLAIFGVDEEIGMIGMVGCEKLPEDGVMWHGFRCGAVYGSDVPLPKDISASAYRYRLQEDGYTEVEAVDGFLMATCCEIPWREDIFDGWDFYDVSQSFEYRRKGKKIVVPKQLRPWCAHNDGILSMWNYEKYKRIFLQEYKGTDEDK